MIILYYKKIMKQLELKQLMEKKVRKKKVVKEEMIMWLYKEIMK